MLEFAKRNYKELLVVNHPDKGGNAFIVNKIEEAKAMIDQMLIKYGVYAEDEYGMTSPWNLYEEKYELLIEQKNELLHEEWDYEAHQFVWDYEKIFPTAPMKIHNTYYNTFDMNPYLSLETAPWAYMDEMDKNWKRRNNLSFKFWKRLDQFDEERNALEILSRHNAHLPHKAFGLQAVAPNRAW